ncbi:MAG: hypothetical protein K0R65_2732 [Crocinitomicaceae bacterium]|jgi:uncharacterized protein YdhG (YjbR/CyaY superfamily)|nr:hypothetical protein [Crocinitomicaceae bacterium]
MKKLLLILMLAFLSGKTLAVETKVMPGYEVVSDKFDASIPKGNYVLTGQVYEVPSMKKLKNISSQVGSAKEVMSATGTFTLTIPLAQSYVAFRKTKYQVSYFESYELQDQHRIVVKIFIKKEGQREPEIREEKPVIYAYSENKLSFDLLLKPKGKLLFTYPLPDANTWHMTVDGQSLKDAAGNSFPYLFWEASHSPEFAFDQLNGKISGKILAQENVLSYLDSVLSHMNFNSREKTDFITYWGPRLTENKYSLVQFVVQDQCARFAEYGISPQPDVFNRFYMVYAGFDRYPGFIEIVPQVLPPFERKGFELLEWGGVCYPAYLNLTTD